MSFRDSLARTFSGGPPFRVKPNEILVEVETNGSAVKRRLSGGSLKERCEDVVKHLNKLGFEVECMENAGILVAKTDRLETVVDNIRQGVVEFSSNVQERAEKVREDSEILKNRTIVGGYGVSQMEFGQNISGTDTEAAIRNELADLSLANPVTEAIEDYSGVINAEMRFTRTTFGPRNLRVDPLQLTSVIPSQEEAAKPELPDVFELMDVEGAHEISTGEDVVLAIFDTAFCEEFFDEDRVIDTYSGDGVDSAFKGETSEGHGTMTAVSAAGNTNEGAPYDGIAKDADLLLARLTDAEGAMANAEEALDWLAQKLEEIDKPVISNHSYGVPLCSANIMGLCDSTATKIARELNKRDNHQAIFAAGNEADYCGRRLSGVTNGINGINSDDSSIAVGAMRSSGTGIQRYSSHGYGTCASGDNKKPDVAAPIPQILPYACETKDMSSGIGGSSGGTSTASPIVAGIAALVASEAGDAKLDTIQGALEASASLPRTTQVNILNNHDARFGNGMVNARKAVEQVSGD